MWLLGAGANAVVQYADKGSSVLATTVVITGAVACLGEKALRGKIIAQTKEETLRLLI